MDKLQMIISSEEVLKQYKEQEYLADLEQQGYDKELKDKLKVLNENIRKYNIPKEQADKLRDELLKEVMLNSKSSQLGAVNALGSPVNVLGSLVRAKSQSSRITRDDVEKVLEDGIISAEAQTGMKIPQEAIDTVKKDLLNTLNTARDDELLEDIYNSPLKTKDINKLGPTELMRNILMSGRWNSLRGLIGYVKKPQLNREEIEGLDRDLLNRYFEAVLRAENDRYNNIFKPVVEKTAINIERNAHLAILKQKMDEFRLQFGMGQVSIAPTSTAITGKSISQEFETGDLSDTDFTPVKPATAPDEDGFVTVSSRKKRRQARRKGKRQGQRT